MVAHTCNLAGGSRGIRTSRSSLPHSEFEASLGYIRLHLKAKQNKNKQIKSPNKRQTVTGSEVQMKKQEWTSMGSSLATGSLLL